MNVSSEPLTIRSIVAGYYSSWSAGRRVRGDVMRSAWSIIRCRTAELGAHVSRCDCGHITHIQYNSCRHRSCPQCRGGRRADWLQKTAAQLLPCDHVHIIFTVPEQLNTLWQFNRAAFSERLMKAARQTLETLLADPRYLGAKPGIISALHTWGRNLSIHPHVHCLVTAGGIDGDGLFVRSKRRGFLPGPVLRAVFRGKLCAFLKAAVASGDLVMPSSMTAAKCQSLLNRLGRVRWNVRVQERYPHGVSVAGYLARYMSGGPISDKRLVQISDEAITFRYKDHRDGSVQLMKLTPHDFLSRWFEHVPPRGLRMIRRSGLYANSLGDVRKRICEQIAGDGGVTVTAPATVAAAGVTPLDPEQCPVCNTCVTVRFVCRSIIDAPSCNIRLSDTVTCFSRPP
jgi:hypothetical protein